MPSERDNFHSQNVAQEFTARLSERFRTPLTEQAQQAVGILTSFAQETSQERLDNEGNMSSLGVFLSTPPLLWRNDGAEIEKAKEGLLFSLKLRFMATTLNRLLEATLPNGASRC